MKMNNKMKALVQIVRGVILLAMGLSLMGCEEAKEVENLNIQDTKPVVEEVENEYCDGCGNRLDFCECNEVEDEVVFNCINCGEAHLESQSYYNEDGMSACCEECYNDYVNGAYEEIEGCEMCGRYDETFLTKTRHNMQVCCDCYYMTCDICLAPKTEKPITFNDGRIHMCNDCYKVEYAEEIANAKVKKAEEEAIQARIDAHEICPECHSENVNWYKENPNLVTEEVARQWWVECYDCGFAN